MTRSEAVNELKRVFVVLQNDIQAALTLGRVDASQFAHRTLIRTHFAYVEGLAYQLRQVTLASLDGTDLLTPAEYALLREQRFQLDAKGLPEQKDNFQKVLPNLLFAIRCYVKNHGAQFEPDTRHHGWDAMRRALEIRDRLTHPKSAAGLEVSEEDAKHFLDAVEWWKMTLLQMFNACGEADEYFRAQDGAE